MPGKGGMQRMSGGYMGYGMGYPNQPMGEKPRKRIDFARLHRDNFGYYNICFQKPEENFNIQEAKGVFEEFGKVAVVHCAAKTVFIRFEERDAAEAALLALMDTDKFERLSIPYDNQRSSSPTRGADEQIVILRNLSENSTEGEVKNMVKDYDPIKVSLQVKEDKIEAKVILPTGEKAKEFIETLEGTEIEAKIAPARKRRVEPMGDDAYYYDAAGNYVEPLESDPRVVELWVGNYPKETTKEELEGWFKKYGGTTYTTMKEKKDKNWGFAFIGMKSINQAQRAIRELHQKKVGSHNIGVRLSQSEQMANPGMQGYDGYGGYMGGGDAEGVGYGGGMNDAQRYEENIIQLRKNTKIQRASHLARGANFMLAEVLDDCSHSDTIQTMMNELCTILDSLLPPGIAPPSQADIQSLVGGSPKQPNVMRSPRGGGMPSEEGPAQDLFIQEQLNQLNRGRKTQPGFYPHGGHGQGMGYHPKHGMYRQ